MFRRCLLAEQISFSKKCDTYVGCFEKVDHYDKLEHLESF